MGFLDWEVALELIMSAAVGLGGLSACGCRNPDQQAKNYGGREVRHRRLSSELMDVGLFELAESLQFSFVELPGNLKFQTCLAAIVEGQVRGLLP